MSLNLDPANDPRAVVLDYTNWRGERSMRTVVPLRIYFGSNEWHPEPQWLMVAFDVKKGAYRDFAQAGIHGFAPVERPESAASPLAPPVPPRIRVHREGEPYDALLLDRPICRMDFIIPDGSWLVFKLGTNTIVDTQRDPEFRKRYTIATAFEPERAKGPNLGLIDDEVE